ncbi:hypothetical protein BGW38_003417 [Lunasporangiospora selenospora]|uniref:Uncharacterized protein n=1 Tax=Lunasporangiospora selenospora TaxID=979761 RepID=A0A9P6FR22_9FUNG|nr:hypothetical protein BGW38_003417 [Lunasporangiospora selenospora]
MFMQLFSRARGHGLVTSLASHSRHSLRGQVYKARPGLCLPKPPSWTAANAQQTRPFLSWLFNPKEDPIVRKQLEPLKLHHSGTQLLYWDSTNVTPNIKPEFNDKDVAAISTGIAHSCAIVNGSIHAWGSNYYSQVGLTTDSYHDDDSEEVLEAHFVNQLGEEEIIQIASGNFHNLALSRSGKLWSWGSGILGRGDEVYDSLPQPIEFFHALGRDIKQVFAAGSYSMALARPKGSQDDELYIWGYLPFGEEGEDGQAVPVMRKSLRPLLITSALGYNISHVACSPWHFTVAATPVQASGAELGSSVDPEVQEKPVLMTFGSYNNTMPLEKPYSPLFLDIPSEEEFYEVKPWRSFRSVSATSDLVIRKLTASKGCDIVLMENGSIGVSDHEDHVARLIHRPLDVSIVDVAGGSSEVIAISEKGQVLAWSEPLLSSILLEDSVTDSSKKNNKDTIPTTTENTTEILQERLKSGGIQPLELHPLLDFFSKQDPQKGETEVLAFFDTQVRQEESKKRKVRLVEALFDASQVVIEKPGLSKCVAQYDRFTIC